MNISNVDKERLLHIYEAHRASFWGVIAAEYGGGVSPFLLEESWRRGIAANAPPTPCISPDTQVASHGSYQSYSTQSAQRLPTAVQDKKNGPASISSLLGMVR